MTMMRSACNVAVAVAVSVVVDDEVDAAVWETMAMVTMKMLSTQSGRSFV